MWMADITAIFRVIKITDVFLATWCEDGGARKKRKEGRPKR